MSSKRLLICGDDDLEVAALSRTARAAGFEILDTARNAIELLRLAELHRPEAALLRNEVNGVSGVEVTEDLARSEPPIEVVLLTSDPTLEPRGLSAGAFAVVRRGDLDSLERALGALGEWLNGGERRTGTDRRRGIDRRQHQDWSKVFSERRSGLDRRRGPRRKADRARHRADDSPQYYG